MTPTSAPVAGETETAMTDGDARRAIRSGQLEMRYLADGDGRRAVLHWPHQTDVPIVERALGGALAEFALHRVCRDACEWGFANDDRRPWVRLSIAVETFRQRSFVTLVRQALLESGLAPTRLQLSLGGANGRVGCPASRQVAEELRAIGIRILTDDADANADPANTDAALGMGRELANVAH